MLDTWSDFFLHGVLHGFRKRRQEYTLINRFTGQSSTVTPSRYWSLWICASSSQTCRKIKSSSYKSFSAEKKMYVLKNVMIDGCSDFWPDKKPWKNTLKWLGSPDHHSVHKLYTEPQTSWIMYLSILLPEANFPNVIKYIISFNNRTLDHWVIVQSFSS